MKVPFTFLLPLAFAVPASGHFVYIVPDASHREVQIVFSENPVPDEKVAIDKITSTQLFAVDAAGNQSVVAWSKSNEHYLSAKLPASGSVVVAGITDYGVTNSKHTGNIPVLIKYYSKAVLGNPAANPQRLGTAVPVEIVPVIREGRLEFAATRGGQPLAAADCVVKSPGDEKGERTQTAADGRVPGRFEKPGRYGVWVKVIDLTPGDVQGAHYDKIHYYATLVVDFPGAATQQ